VDLMYFILAAYGMTQLIVYGTIFNKIRPTKEWLWGFGELFNCPMCMGFWVGVFLCGINDYTELFTFDHTVINYFVLGCISSGTSYILCMTFDDFGLKLKFKE
jgi:hypothetical protein